jgi:alpha-N-arabinofuranosidase
MPYRNPVIPGFYPDPTICRVGRDYYLATSSFEYFPGVPLFHSRDLVDWAPIGHCLTRPEQLPLAGCRASGGIFAPTLRHHAGRFYMVTTNVTGGGHFYVHADDPAGPWSDPIWIDTGLLGIDPDLFWDDDGTCYFTATSGRGIVTCPLDMATGKALAEPCSVWNGSGGQHPEAPHLFKINGLYYLQLAEGGTERGHMVTIARSASLDGPWEPCPHNPILSHRSTDRPIQSTGHADMVQAHDGSWWMVFLGTRPHGVYPTFHNLGRETNLAPVRWTEDGWPVVGEGGLADLQSELPAIAQQAPTRWDRVVEDTFETEALAFHWNHLRNPDPARYSLSQLPGFLRLWGAAPHLGALDSPTWVGRRQQHHEMTATARLHFQPQTEGEEAGLSVLMNDRHRIEIAVAREGGARVVLARRTIGSLTVVTARQELPSDGPVELTIAAATPHVEGARARWGGEPVYQMSCAVDGGAPVRLDAAEMRYLATEVAGGFTGVYLGMYATGNGQDCETPADFEWFRYEPTGASN